MKIEQSIWMPGTGWSPQPSAKLKNTAQLVLMFGATDLLSDTMLFDAVRSFYPAAHIVGCTTSGEICGTQVLDNSLVITAVAFEHSAILCASVSLGKAGSSLAVGEQLASLLEKDGLVHAFVLSNGLKVNGTELVEGLTRHLPETVTITGGLAGDGERFMTTLVACDGPPDDDTVAVIGFYGERLKVGFGSLGGWDPFGPERLITRSSGNVLYELDGKSALELYKKYLGEHASELPASGLLFPLSIRTAEREAGVVRTILAINEDEQSITFAGDIPEGGYARLMKANFERLIDGATGAAVTSYEAVGSVTPELAILISCVGRKLVLKQRTEEEVEAVRDVLGEGAVLTGFYSYGEISPFTPGARCEMHNQTMTITTISER
jgi:hypothetical protein